MRGVHQAESLADTALMQRLFHLRRDIYQPIIIATASYRPDWLICSAGRIMAANRWS
jgi:hypothetical protein